jgi:hypothetical protein
MLTKIKKIAIVVAMTLLGVMPGTAQDVAIKTNLLGWAAGGTMNAGVEVGTSKKVTLQVVGALNPWTYGHVDPETNVGGKRARLWLVQPEVKYWFCDRFAGHYIGFHALGGQYNFGNLDNGIKFLGSDFSKLSDYRYQGWYIGAGVAYGYDWILAKHWNLEVEIGVGYIYTRFDKFECNGCGKKVESDKDHHYVGPTSAALNLVYTF